MRISPKDTCHAGDDAADENSRDISSLSMLERRIPACETLGVPEALTNQGRVKGEYKMIRRFMVMIALAVALFPMCGDGNEP